MLGSHHEKEKNLQVTRGDTLDLYTVKRDNEHVRRGGEGGREEKDKQDNPSCLSISCANMTTPTSMGVSTNLEVFGSVTSQLQHFCAQVLEDGRAVHSSW